MPRNSRSSEIVSKKIGIEKSKGNNIDDLMSQVNSTADSLKSFEDRLVNIQNDLQVFLLDIPNIPNSSVPDGANEHSNHVIRESGSARSFNFALKIMLILVYYMDWILI